MTIQLIHRNRAEVLNPVITNGYPFSMIMWSVSLAMLPSVFFYIPFTRWYFTESHAGKQFLPVLWAIKNTKFKTIKIWSNQYTNTKHDAQCNWKSQQDCFFNKIGPRHVVHIFLCKERESLETREYMPQTMWCWIWSTGSLVDKFSKSLHQYHTAAIS